MLLLIRVCKVCILYYQYLKPVNLTSKTETGRENCTIIFLWYIIYLIADGIVFYRSIIFLIERISWKMEKQKYIFQRAFLKPNTGAQSISKEQRKKQIYNNFWNGVPDVVTKMFLFHSLHVVPHRIRIICKTFLTRHPIIYKCVSCLLIRNYSHVHLKLNK